MSDYIKLFLAQIPEYFINLLEVWMHPNRFIASRLPIDNEQVLKAFVFFGITTFISSFLNLPFFPKQKEQIEIVITLALLGGMFVLLELILLKMSSSLVGGRASINELFVCTAYLTAPGSYMLIICALIGRAMFIALDPEGAVAYRNNPLIELPQRSPEQDGYAAENFMMAIGVIVVIVWMFFTWKSYRLFNKISKFRSFLAFFIYATLLIPSFLLYSFMFFPLVMQLGE